MKAPVHPTPELRELVDQCLDGTLDDLSRFHLERLIRDDPSALAYYMELAGNEALLAARLGASAKLPIHKPAVRKSRVWLAAAAVVLALATATALWDPHTNNLASSQKLENGGGQPTTVSEKLVPVRITGLVGVRSDGSDRLRLYDRPDGNHLMFDAGLLELTFDQGATLLLQGPVDIEITGPNSCRLSQGRLVANIPVSARGFTVDYLEGQLVDHGTEFALDVDETGSAMEVAVFRGEVELFETPTPEGLKLFTDYAVKRTKEGLESSTFDRSRFVREIPSREFTWDMRGTPIEASRDFLYNITPLVHGSGEFRIIFRHLQGGDEIDIERVEIRRNGRSIAYSDAIGHTGETHLPGRFNDYRLTIPTSEWGDGRWELAFRAKSPRVDQKDRSSTSRGIVCFEEGLSVEARSEHFVGRWAYSHGKSTYVRDIRADGTARLYINGKLVSKESFDGQWSVSENVMEIRFANSTAPEKHYLRDISTLVFLDKNYRNAHRVGDVGQ